MKTRRLIIIIIIGIVAIVATYYGAGYFLERFESSLPGALENWGGVGDPIIAPSYVGDFNDSRVLVGYAQEVFAGKVLRETGSQSANVAENTSLPHYQYEVEVLYNIKGHANSIIQVDLDALEGARFTPGATYLLAARYWQETHPWYYVGPTSAFGTLVSNNENLSNTQLLELVKKHVRTYELLNAYPNEILRKRDIDLGRAVNSFISLSDADKQMVYAKFAELIPPRPVPEILPPPPPTPIPENFWSVCTDGIDNDNDGLVDKSDPDCAGVLTENKPSTCRDNIDDDNDGLTDAADPDCAPFYPTPPTPQPPAPPPPPPISTSTQQ